MAAVGEVVTLISCDSVELKISLKVAKKIELVARLMEDLGESSKNVPIPIPRINAEALNLVIEFLEKHGEDAATSGEEKRELNDWDKKFFERHDQTILFSIIMAANFLQIQDLLDSSCKFVAGMIRGKSVEEIRKTFGIKNDFTPDEEEAIRLENAWCEE